MAAGDAPRQLRRCFLSARFGDPDADRVANLLRNCGVEITDLARLAPGASIVEHIDRSIRQADFVAIVLSEQPSQAVLAEAKLARSTGKPMLLFGAGDAPGLDIQGVYRLQLPRDADVHGDLGRLRDDVERFLLRAKPPAPLRLDPKSGPRPDLRWARGWLAFARSVGAARGRGFEALVASLFEASGAEIALTGDGADNGVDFVAWLDDVAFELGGPVLVQCKVLGGGTGSVLVNAKTYLDRMSRALDGSDAGFGLLIIDHDRGRSLPVSQRPDVVCLSVEELIAQIEEGRLEAEILRRRERARLQGAPR